MDELAAAVCYGNWRQQCVTANISKGLEVEDKGKEDISPTFSPKIRKINKIIDAVCLDKELKCTV